MPELIELHHLRQEIIVSMLIQSIQILELVH